MLALFHFIIGQFTLIIFTYLFILIIKHYYHYAERKLSIYIDGYSRYS